MELRRTRRLGPKRIQAELLRLHACRLSTATIWKILAAHNASQLQRRRRHPEPKRYSRPIPGERVQMDTFKVAPGQYQYTAIDDCTRVRVLGLYPRRTAKNTVHFLVNRVVEEMPFPIQRVQTDRGTEFFGVAVQDQLRAFSIKFRPTPPRSPHLNGKVERSQQTDWIEFYSTADLTDPKLSGHLEEWQFFYNWHRPHSGLNGQTPMARYIQVLSKTPFESDLASSYNLETERFQERNYWVDQQLRRLKACL